ncbi:hypothetical protein RF11_15013 [Thelohanellus kitauei]|uniref:Uncharacterized protein n=1 Tax=Thelohanellus kitauei TaxID=669202 RepID=A0A0C2MHG4_THEKT|nr:hypothetical protein RF11_15013 [Thelohanellus kitauei]
MYCKIIEDQHPLFKISCRFAKKLRQRGELDGNFQNNGTITGGYLIVLQVKSLTKNRAEIIVYLSKMFDLCIQMTLCDWYIKVIDRSTHGGTKFIELIQFLC